MKINSKAPTGFILDLSLLMDTVDAERTISPLTWQFVIEQDLVNKCGWLVLEPSVLPDSLLSQARLITFLQDHQKFNIVNCIPGQLVLYLRKFGVEIKMSGNTLFIVKK
jgi:hypothetical protein